MYILVPSVFYWLVLVIIPLIVTLVSELGLKLYRMSACVYFVCLTSVLDPLLPVVKLCKICLRFPLPFYLSFKERGKTGNYTVYAVTTTMASALLQAVLYYRGNKFTLLTYPVYLRVLLHVNLI
jgi:hypothetical protein